MSRHLKLHAVELIASILLVGVYSLLFVPFVWYFDFVRPIHLAGFSGGIIFLNLAYGTTQTWWKHRGKHVPEENAEQVYSYLEELSEEFNTQKPRLVVFKSEVPNAYATDTLPTRPIVALTDNLIDTLEPRELKSVIAHEMSHIRSYDIFFMLFLSSFVNVVEKAHNTTVKFLNSADGAFEILLVLPFFIITYINITIVYAILFFVSRVREYVADRDAASVTSPEAMKSALKTIETEASSAPEPAKKQFAAQSALTITPLEDISATLFRTHPKTEKRIAKLDKLDGVELESPSGDTTENTTETNSTEENTDDETEPEQNSPRDSIEDYVSDEEDDETENEDEENSSQNENEEETESDSNTDERVQKKSRENQPAGTSNLQDLSEINTNEETKLDEVEADMADETNADKEDEDDESDDEDDVDYPTDLSLRGDDM